MIKKTGDEASSPVFLMGRKTAPQQNLRESGREKRVNSTRGNKGMIKKKTGAINPFRI
jgi:hypothetical protein